MTVVRALGVLTLVLAAGAPVIATASGPGELTLQGIRVTGDRVSISVVGQPLTTVLGALATQSGVKLVILQYADKIVSLTVADVPIDVAFRKLMEGNGSGALVFETGEQGGGRLTGAYLALGVSGRLQDSRGGPPSTAAGSPNAPPATYAPYVSTMAPGEAEQHLRAGSPEDFVAAAVALYPNAKRPIDAIYETMHHPDAGVRANALSAIAEMGSGERAREALEDATRDGDPVVRDLARRMLYGGSSSGSSPSRR